MAAKYVIGESPIPAWCRKQLTPYRKLDGSTGYEYAGRVEDYELSPGDVLIKDGERVAIKRMGGKKVVQHDSGERVSPTGEKA